MANTARGGGEIVANKLTGLPHIDIPTPQTHRSAGVIPADRYCFRSPSREKPHLSYRPAAHADGQTFYASIALFRFSLSERRLEWDP